MEIPEAEEYPPHLEQPQSLPSAGFAAPVLRPSNFPATRSKPIATPFEINTMGIPLIPNPKDVEGRPMPIPVAQGTPLNENEDWANPEPIGFRDANPLEFGYLNASQMATNQLATVLLQGARSVATPTDFAQVLGTTSSGVFDATGIRSLPIDHRSEPLMQLGWRIHRMQGENVPRAELTMQLIEAINEIPVQNRDFNLVRLESLARRSLETPNSLLESAVDSVLQDVAGTQSVARFYNINFSVLRQAVASRRSLSDANLG